MPDYTNLTLGGGNYGMQDQDWAKYVKGLNGMPAATGGLNSLTKPFQLPGMTYTDPSVSPNRQSGGFGIPGFDYQNFNSGTVFSNPTAPSVVDRTKPYQRPKEIGGMEPMPVQTGGMEPSPAGIPGFDYRNFNSGTTVGNPTSPVVLPERKLPPMNAGPLQPPNAYTGPTVDWSPVALSQKLSEERRNANAGQANFNAPAPQAPMQLNNGFMSGGQNGDTRSNAGGFYGTPGYFQARGEPWRIK